MNILLGDCLGNGHTNKYTRGYTKIRKWTPHHHNVAQIQTHAYSAHCYNDWFSDCWMIVRLLVFFFAHFLLNAIYTIQISTQIPFNGKYFNFFFSLKILRNVKNGRNYIYGKSMNFHDVPSFEPMVFFSLVWFETHLIKQSTYRIAHRSRYQTYSKLI